jgi:hypothetical protein
MTDKETEKLIAKHALLMFIALEGIRDLCNLHVGHQKSHGDASLAMQYIKRITDDVLDRTRIVNHD